MSAAIQIAPPVRLLTLLSLIVAGALLAGQAMANPGLDKASHGPRVGSKIPHQLTTADHSGAAQNFQKLVGKNGLILLFSRSVDW